MPNNHCNQPRHLSEALQHRDLEGMLKSTVHVDEFASKMGDDADIIVLSFFVRDKTAARNLMSWFEKGYDFVVDADQSPGEIKPNRYLVFVEIRRRSAAARHVTELLGDLNTLTEFSVDDWTMHYKNKNHSYSEEEFARLVPLSPDQYRRATESDLNDIREAAGIAPRRIHKLQPDLKALQSAAGI